MSVTTAASDTSSSADSRYCSSGPRRGNLNTALEATSVPALWWSPPVQTSPVQPSPLQTSQGRSCNLKARGVVIAKDTPNGGSRKVFCTCKACKGQRLVSKSTCYRHLRVEAEIAEDDVKWEARHGALSASHQEALRMYGFLQLHLPGIRLGL